MRKPRTKGLGFIMAFLVLVIISFASTLDGMALSVALPVGVGFRTIRVSMSLLPLLMYTSILLVIEEVLHATTLDPFYAGIAFLLTNMLFQPIHTIFSKTLNASRCFTTVWLF